MSAAVIACGDPPPVLKSSKHVFDLMALFIQRFAVGGRRFPSPSRWDAGCNPLGFESRAIVVAVIAFVADEDFGVLRQSRVEYLRPNMIAGLAVRQAHHDRAALAVDDSMQLGVQSAFGAPDTAGNIPFFSRLEAVRCALRCVASIISVSGGSPSAVKRLNISLKTPILLHRMKRL